MNGKLSSLTDVLKKTLYFFEGLSVTDAVPYVHRKMLQDYTPGQVEEKVRLCLNQNPCFFSDRFGFWHLNSEGARENDKFFTILSKKQQPMSLREVIKNSSTKKRQLQKLADEAALVTDGRFIQLENGHWGLTQWDLEMNQYSLKHLLIKAISMHSQGIEAQELHEVVNNWRPCSIYAVKQNLSKFPYFEKDENNRYTYDRKLHAFHDKMIARYLNILRRQKQKWQYDREKWKIKTSNMERQLLEVSSAQREAAVALAERVSIMDQYHHLATQLSEKDLLLSMRKKEILRYREQMNKLDAKANSILHQCRIWVSRTKEKEFELQRTRKIIDKSHLSLETMFTKLQQYKEKDRENKAKIAELKEHYTTRIAELQTEIVELKQKLEKVQDYNEHEERRLYQDLNDMSNDLKEALETGEELQKSIKLLQKELDLAREEKKRLEYKLSPLPVRIALRVCNIFGLKI